VVLPAEIQSHGLPKHSTVAVGSKYMQIKRKRIKNVTHLKIDNFIFENVKTFNYLGSILNADNKMNI
jgi:hypothetical protein